MKVNICSNVIRQAKYVPVGKSRSWTVTWGRCAVWLIKHATRVHGAGFALKKAMFMIPLSTGTRSVSRRSLAPVIEKLIRRQRTGRRWRARCVLLNRFRSGARCKGEKNALKWRRHRAPGTSYGVSEMRFRKMVGLS